MIETGRHYSEKPIALVVEDKASTLSKRQQLLSKHGFQAIGARSVAEAFREFRGMPTIDIVVTDINLDQNNDQDRSGVDLARAMRERRPTLPVVALSGHFDSLDAEQREPFDDYLLKAGLSVNAMEQKLGEWRDRALAYRHTRAERARSELRRMRSSGARTEPAVDVLRDFMPVARRGEGHEDPLYIPDDLLSREGWRLRLVDAGFPLADRAVRTSVAVPFWIRRDGSRTIAVLHGHPCIYHDADNEEAAVQDALALMFGYFLEFTRDDSKAMTGELEHLAQYVKKVFG
nr:response regulator [uncultured Steroidobacter sp.]